MKLLIGMLAILMTGQAFAINCTIMTTNRSANCHATFKQDKAKFMEAAHQNCKNSGFPGFGHATAWEDCNSNGTKCKKMQAECAAKSTNPMPKPKPGSFNSNLNNQSPIP